MPVPSLQVLSILADRQRTTHNPAPTTADNHVTLGVLAKVLGEAIASIRKLRSGCIHNIKIFDFTEARHHEKVIQTILVRSPDSALPILFQAIVEEKVPVIMTLLSKRPSLLTLAPNFTWVQSEYTQQKFSTEGETALTIMMKRKQFALLNHILQEMCIFPCDGVMHGDMAASISDVKEQCQEAKKCLDSYYKKAATLPFMGKEETLTTLIDAFAREGFSGEQDYTLSDGTQKALNDFQMVLNPEKIILNDYYDMDLLFLSVLEQYRNSCFYKTKDQCTDPEYQRNCFFTDGVIRYILQVLPNSSLMSKLDTIVNIYCDISQKTVDEALEHLFKKTRIDKPYKEGIAALKTIKTKDLQQIMEEFSKKADEMEGKCRRIEQEYNTQIATCKEEVDWLLGLEEKYLGLNGGPR